MSRAYVRAGQSVRTLGSIGAVGCTGWCTGPHVHFEVRVNGQHQNPMRWL
jgi:murein DD-endopeptidase MepM/ murein hydrolase activator NlpD